MTLSLTMDRTIVGAVSVTVHRVQQDWGEANSVAPGEGGAGQFALPEDATWLHTFWNSQFWASPDGDFQATASATQSVGGNGVYSWNASGLVADVQTWVDDPNANFGWLLAGPEGGPGQRRPMSDPTASRASDVRARSVSL